MGFAFHDVLYLDSGHAPPKTLHLEYLRLMQMHCEVAQVLLEFCELSRYLSMQFEP